MISGISILCAKLPAPLNKIIGTQLFYRFHLFILKSTFR